VKKKKRKKKAEMYNFLSPNRLKLISPQ